MVTQLTDSIIFFQRTFPSANMTLILGEKPILIDTGFGSDFPETEDFLNAAGVAPQDLHLIINTHYHSDHVGGNHQLQTRYAKPIAAYHNEAQLINQRDMFACNAEWLRQPIEPYTVDQSLHAGDVISTGAVDLEVHHTPGHTLGHISLYAPQAKLLILGDVVHADDVAWLNNFREGVGALERMLATLENLLKIPAERAVSGHGAVHENPQEIMRGALTRYEKWQKNPEKIAWHAMKRIYSYALMLTDGMARDDVADYLVSCPWFVDFTRSYFQTSAADFVPTFLDEMLRSRATAWVDDKLVATTAYHPLRQDWYPARTMPRYWSKLSLSKT